MKNKENKKNPTPIFRNRAKPAIAIDYIILDDSIKFKAKHIKNVPSFSSVSEKVLVPNIDNQFKDFYVSGRFSCGDVIVKIEVKDKKLLKLINLFHAMKKISFTMVNVEGTKIISTGIITSIDESIEGDVSFTYLPDQFSVA